MSTQRSPPDSGSRTVAVAWSRVPASPGNGAFYGVSTQVDVKEIDENERILVEWDVDSAPTTVEWRFTPHGDDATFVNVVNSGFHGDGDAVVAAALDSTGGFSWVLAGAKAWLEHGLALNLARSPSRRPRRRPGACRTGVELESIVRAPIDIVWQTLTSSEEIESWYAFDGARSTCDRVGP